MQSPVGGEQFLEAPLSPVLLRKYIFCSVVSGYTAQFYNGALHACVIKMGDLNGTKPGDPDVGNQALYYPSK